MNQGNNIIPSSGAVNAKLTSFINPECSTQKDSVLPTLRGRLVPSALLTTQKYGKESKYSTVKVKCKFFQWGKCDRKNCKYLHEMPEPKNEIQATDAYQKHLELLRSNKKDVTGTKWKGKNSKKPASSTPEDTTFYCELCDVVLNDVSLYETHAKGVKHLRAVIVAEKEAGAELSESLGKPALANRKKVRKEGKLEEAIETIEGEHLSDESGSATGQPDTSKLKDKEYHDMNYVGEGEIKEEIMIPNDKVGVIIGKKGTNLKILKRKSGARIFMNAQGISPNEPKPMILIGVPEDVARAKELVHNRLKEYRNCYDAADGAVTTEHIIRSIVGEIVDWAVGEKKVQDDVVFVCKLCSISVFCKKTYETHISGARHLKKMLQSNKVKEQQQLKDNEEQIKQRMREVLESKESTMLERNEFWSMYEVMFSELPDHKKFSLPNLDAFFIMFMDLIEPCGPDEDDPFSVVKLQTKAIASDFKDDKSAAERLKERLLKEKDTAIKERMRVILANAEANTMCREVFWTEFETFYGYLPDHKEFHLPKRYKDVFKPYGPSHDPYHTVKLVNLMEPKDDMGFNWFGLRRRALQGQENSTAESSTVPKKKAKTEDVPENSSDDNFIDRAQSQVVSKLFAQAIDPKPKLKPKIGFTAEYFCEICKIDCSVKEIYENHLQGSMHQCMLKQMEENKTVNDQPHHCHVCGVDCETAEGYDSHINEPAHKDNVIELKRQENEDANQKAKDKNISTESVTKDSDSANTSDDRPFYCHVCRFDCMNLRNYQTHTRGMIHTQAVMKEEAAACNATLVESHDGSVYLPKGMVRTEQGTLQIATSSSTMEGKKVDQSYESLRAGLDDLPFSCKPCGVRMSGPKTYEMHMNGNRHMRTLQNLSKGVLPQKRNPSDVTGKDTEGVARAQAIVDKHSDGPLIGLQNITEFIMKFTEDCKYVCNLCESKCDINALIPHCKGTKHRLHYIKEFYMNYYTTIRQLSVRKSEMSKVLEGYATTIEEIEGRQKIKVKYIENSDLLDKTVKALLEIGAESAFDTTNRKRAPPKGAFILSTEQALGGKKAKMDWGSVSSSNNPSKPPNQMNRPNMGDTNPGRDTGVRGRNNRNTMAPRAPFRGGYKPNQYPRPPMDRIQPDFPPPARDPDVYTRREMHAGPLPFPDERRGLDADPYRSPDDPQFSGPRPALDDSYRRRLGSANDAQLPPYPDDPYMRRLALTDGIQQPLYLDDPYRRHPDLEGDRQLPRYPDDLYRRRPDLEDRPQPPYPNDPYRRRSHLEGGRQEPFYPDDLYRRPDLEDGRPQPPFPNDPYRRRHDLEDRQQPLYPDDPYRTSDLEDGKPQPPFPNNPYQRRPALADSRQHPLYPDDTHNRATAMRESAGSNKPQQPAVQVFDYGSNRQSVPDQGGLPGYRGHSGNYGVNSPYQSSPRNANKGQFQDHRNPGVNFLPPVGSQYGNEEPYNMRPQPPPTGRDNYRPMQPPPLPPIEPSPNKPPLPPQEPQRHSTDNKAEFMNVIGNLSQCLVNSEEEASMALQVSNALTQALIQYRVQGAPDAAGGMPPSGAGDYNGGRM